MVKMTPEEWRRVAHAIVFWSGWSRSSRPLRSEEALAAHLGEEAATQLLPIIRELEDDFYLSDARHTAADLAEMEKISEQQFIQRYPEVPRDAARALAWCYTFDYK